MFARGLVTLRDRVVGERVAGIHLDDVVDQQDAEPRQQVIDRDVGGRVLGENHGHHRGVPGVLGAVLEARPTDERRAALHGLQSIDVGEEGELAVEAFASGMRGATLPASARARTAESLGTRGPESLHVAWAIGGARAAEFQRDLAEG